MLGIYTTEVKHQGKCGSSWAMTATAQIESDAIRTLGWDRNTPLSAAQLLECALGERNGCDGDSTFENSAGFDYATVNGITTDVIYPYDLNYYGACDPNNCQSLTCPASSNDNVLQVRKNCFSYTEQEMAAHVQNTGPLTAAIDATNWQYYTGGLMTLCSSENDDLVIYSPTLSPTQSPSSNPSIVPTQSPSSNPSIVPSQSPFSNPSIAPTQSPSSNPSIVPNQSPSSKPSIVPTQLQSSKSTIIQVQFVGVDTAANPPYWKVRNSWGTNWGEGGFMRMQYGVNMCGLLTVEGEKATYTEVQYSPTVSPTQSLSSKPSIVPTQSPSSNPSIAPTQSPSSNPSIAPTQSPSSNPRIVPTQSPSSNPSIVATQSPSSKPSIVPTQSPSSNPSIVPTQSPSSKPSIVPTQSPSSKPSIVPTQSPSSNPTIVATQSPSSYPSIVPTQSPSSY